MEVIILGSGTSQGIPVIGCNCNVCRSSDPKDKRLRTSVLIKSEGLNILIDAGPDFRQQMLREGIDKLDAIILTHEHRDHIGGLDDIRAFNYINRAPMSIYAEKRVLNAVEKEFSYAFSNSEYPGIPKFDFRTITEEVFYIENLRIEPIRVMHCNLPVLGFKFENLAFITDASYISEEELLKITNINVLIINALRKSKHISHFSLDEALEVINRCKPNQTLLTHISDRMGLNEEINNELPPFVSLAFDGQKIII